MNSISGKANDKEILVSMTLVTTARNRPGSVTNDEARRDDVMLGLGPSLIDAFEEPVHRHSTHFDALLVDTGQGDVSEGGHRSVVVAQEGDVSRNGEPRFFEGVERADGAQIVGGEDGGR